MNNIILTSQLLEGLHVNAADQICFKQAENNPVQYEKTCLSRWIMLLYIEYRRSEPE